MTTLAPRENPLLFGHAAAEGQILDALRSGRMHHAWLVTGSPGVGKATLAYRFARRLLAGIHPGDTLAVDPASPVFRRIAIGSHADLLTVEREWDEKKSRLRGEIVVDDVRAVSNFLRLTPAEGGWRVVVVDGAEHMNRNAANALLKMLEEPPPRAVLLLTCAAPGRLLPTIRSRCRRLGLLPLTQSEMETGLSDYLPDTPVLERSRLAELAAGSLGRALLLSEEKGLQLAALASEVLDNVPDLPKLRAFAIAEALGGRAEDRFTPFMTLLRDALSDSVRRAARGSSERLADVRPLAEWVEVWQSLTHIQIETERLNLDRRQALLSSIALLNGP
ncbi:DNA polymerase III subunit delta' [Acidisphaera sp. L21]|jgi:DNA polymerase-3 subunit delta'|uniref:DNA polymerase III subunit delta' n=1 Tax=Acidisphaera sp. L21 TaxID=1641851 RepID=UPI00131B76B5|nr:DNA polymerase III subunit delta' [Acidisphaera sp. L21]